MYGVRNILRYSLNKFLYLFGVNITSHVDRDDPHHFNNAIYQQGTKAFI